LHAWESDVQVLLNLESCFALCFGGSTF